MHHCRHLAPVSACPVYKPPGPTDFHLADCKQPAPRSAFPELPQTALPATDTVLRVFPVCNPLLPDQDAAHTDYLSAGRSPDAPSSANSWSADPRPPAAPVKKPLERQSRISAAASFDLLRSCPHSAKHLPDRHEMSPMPAQFRIPRP